MHNADEENQLPLSKKHYHDEYGNVINPEALITICRHCVFGTMDREDAKEVIKEALKEWLEEKYAEVGKWTIRGIFAALTAAILYVASLYNGWYVK